MVKRKNFLPTFLTALFFWASFICLVIFTTPTSPFLFEEKLCLLSTFYFLLSVALFLTLSLVLANSRRGFLLTTETVVFLFLRQLKMANILNLFLLTAVLLSLELYLKKR